MLRLLDSDVGGGPLEGVVRGGSLENYVRGVANVLCRVNEIVLCP